MAAGGVASGATAGRWSRIALEKAARDRTLGRGDDSLLAQPDLGGRVGGQKRLQMQPRQRRVRGTLQLGLHRAQAQSSIPHCQFDGQDRAERPGERGRRRARADIGGDLGSLRQQGRVAQSLRAVLDPQQ